LIGTKTLALPYAFLLFVPFTYLCLKKGGAGLNPFLLSVILLVIFGGFTYLRNLFETGNPLFPLDIKLGSWYILKGVISPDTYRVHFLASDYSLEKILFHEGLGVQTVIFILPSLFLALPLVLKKRRGWDWLWIYFLLLPFLFLLVFRFIIPLANTRYLYAFLGIGIILGFLVAELLAIPRKVLNAVIILSSFASLPEMARGRELAVSLALSVLFCILLLLLEKHSLNFRFRKNAVFTFCLVAFIIFSLKILESYYIKNEYPGYSRMQKYSGFWPDAIEGWNWLNNNTSTHNVAYAGRPVPFPLYGTNLKNNVFYVSINETEPAKLHYFPNSHYRWGYEFLTLHKSLEDEGNYRFKGTYLTWLANLDKRNVDFLFIYSLHQIDDIIFPIEDAWAAAHPEKFKLEFSNKTVKIYRVSR
jgi:hypothetical protein